MFLLKPTTLLQSIRASSKNLRFLLNDPGIRNRKPFVGNVEDVDEDFDDLESDFMNVHHSHKEHLEEMHVLGEKLKYDIVKQKYFKEKFPNFLTWYDKVQIRHLYCKDPEEWTIDNLSESFPALPETIKKIVKSDYTKKNERRVASHDSAVKKNWELFKAGQLSELPEDLQRHLERFTKRTLILNSFQVEKKPMALVNSGGKTEYLDIIKSYEKIKNNVEAVRKEEESSVERINDNKWSYKNRAPITLTALQGAIKQEIETGRDVTEEDVSIITKTVNQSKPVTELKVDSELMANKFEKGSVISYQRKEKDYSHLSYPEFITIPKKQIKKGAIYKLNDCFYDDDGYFLYRVPGMV